MEGEASTETRINLALREFAGCLPRFSDGRIDYTESSTAPVLNCIVYYQGCILLLKRSHEVGTYKGQWGAVTGFIDRPEPLRDIILIELREELAVKEGDISSITIAEPYRFYDAAISKTWLIHPVLVEIGHKPSIRLDWEHTEYCWIKPSDITALDTMPGQTESIKRALRKIAC